MAVTMGFVLRVDSYPTAVAIPSMQQGMRPVPPIIEAQRIVEPIAIMHSNNTRNHLHRTDTIISSEPSTLSYSAKGIAQRLNQHETGHLINTYA